MPKKQGSGGVRAAARKKKPRFGNRRYPIMNIIMQRISGEFRQGFT